MRYYFDGIIVVEGKADVAFLSSFIDALYVTTNGYAIDDEEIDFIRHSNLPTIVLVDSDEAGKSIRKELSSLISDFKDVEVDISCCNKNGKHGIAECFKEEIIRVLGPFLSKTTKKLENITCSDLYQLGLDDQDKRIYLCQILHLGKCNNKTLIKRLNFVGLNFADVEKIIKEKYGNK